MVYPTTYTFQPAANGYICAAQQVTGAAAMILNGTGVDVNSAAINSPRMTLTGSGFERKVSLTSSGTTSGVNFTIVGTNIRGAAVTETIAGPVVNTVYTTANFYTVTSVTTSATLGTNVSIGIGTTGQSQWYKVDYNKTPVNIGMGQTVSGTDLTYTIVQTTYNVETAEPPAAAIINNADTNLVNATTSTQGNYIVPFNACRAKVTASSNGSFVWNIYEAGIV